MELTQTLYHTYRKINQPTLPIIFPTHALLGQSRLVIRPTVSLCNDTNTYIDFKMADTNSFLQYQEIREGIQPVDFGKIRFENF